MKILSIQYFNHPVFLNHKVTFDSNGVKAINFIIGNNGSGKTKVLDTIYESFVDNMHGQFGDKTYEIHFEILLSTEESALLNESNNKFTFVIDKSANGISKKIIDPQSGNQIRHNEFNFIKMIYSTVEVNFGGANIQSVTGKNIDDNKAPKERSSNLSNEIPQLLIDISNLDDGEIASSVRNANASVSILPQDILKNHGTRLSRFTNAFDKIYGNSKKFEKIDNRNGSKNIIFKDNQGQEVTLNDLSTGEKQIIYRIGYILKNLGNINGAIILIDEPEISLHPEWQIKLKDFLEELFTGYDVQFIIATHSPYIFKSFKPESDVCIKIDRLSDESKSINLTFNNVNYIPSTNLINYLVYNIFDELLHIELYTLLQIREKRSKISLSNNGKSIEEWFLDSNGGNLKIHKTFQNSNNNNTETKETLPTWIRNQIHHSDNKSRGEYSKLELQASIDLMIELLSK
jgi:predicted ATP-binding protein involved in virulence